MMSEIDENIQIWIVGSSFL